VLSEGSVERARSLQAEGTDALLAMPMRMSLGFWLTQPGVAGLSFGPNPNAFGHPGAGGGLGFADPDARVGFGYVTNRMGHSLAIDERPAALADVFYECLA
jgi:CubicO group peptidase (beta-lactamase class C family)